MQCQASFRSQLCMAPETCFSGFGRPSTVLDKADSWVHQDLGFCQMDEKGGWGAEETRGFIFVS